MDDPTKPDPANIVEEECKTEGTEFKQLWPHVKKNLITMDRIRESDVPVIFSDLW